MAKKCKKIRDSRPTSSPRRFSLALEVENSEAPWGRGWCKSKVVVVVFIFLNKPFAFLTFSLLSLSSLLKLSSICAARPPGLAGPRGLLWADLLCQAVIRNNAKVSANRAVAFSY